MSAMLWPAAAVAIAAFAWHGWRLHILTRRQMTEDRIAEAEKKLAELANTGRVLGDHQRRIASLEGWRQRESEVIGG